MSLENMIMGNNDWLDYKNKNGEFAIAYMGINNFQGDKSKMVSDLNNYAKDIRRVIPNKLYRRDSNRRNSGIFKYLFDYTECGDGICLFQNPKYAENSAGIPKICRKFGWNHRCSWISN